MNIVINSCAKSQSGTWWVRFSSPYGQAEAEWYGAPPAVDQTYNVELEIPQVVAWGKEITPESQTVPAVGLAEDGHYIVGLLEQVEVDGCVTIRIGSSVTLLEASGRAIVSGGYVRVRFDRLILYDTGL